MIPGEVATCGAGYVAGAKDNIPVRLMARTSLSAHTST